MIHVSNFLWYAKTSQNLNLWRERSFLAIVTSQTIIPIYKEEWFRNNFLLLCHVYLLLAPWSDDPLQWLVRQVVPQLSCPIALFTYYNPILKRGTEGFMSIIKETGVHGMYDSTQVMICQSFTLCHASLGSNFCISSIIIQYCNRQDKEAVPITYTI